MENLRKYAKKMDASLLQSKTTRKNTEDIYRDLGGFKNYWKYLSKQVELKLRLEISFILKDKTKEGVEVHNYFVHQKNE